MKKNLIIWISIAVVIFSACKSDDSPSLSISQASYSVTAEKQSLSLAISSNSSWTAVSDTDWCVPSVASGEGDYTLPVSIAANTSTSARSATLTIGYNNTKVPVTVKQAGAAAFISLSTTASNVAYNTESQVITVTSNTSWTVSSDQSWCSPTVTSGTGNKDLIVSLDGNITTSARTATLTFTAGTLSATTTIKQAGGNGDEYHYKIPVIFHVLYNNASDSLQYVKSGWMSTILTGVNKLYSNNNMNMEFELATYDPKGNILSEPGIDREKISVSSIDCDNFMNGKAANNSTYVSMLWDLNKYVNVYLYVFYEDPKSQYTTMGITDLPYVSTSYPLSGLSNGEYYLTHSFDYPQCVSINSSYIYEVTNTKYYNSLDVTVTLAHELGHYVGLFHPFTETGETACSGTDYCNDTPNYDRTTYETWLSNYKYVTGTTTLADLAVRTSCDDGSTFIGHNIMDYEYCYSDKFTSDQRTRARYLLNYGLFIPGPKYSTTSKSSRSVINATRPPIHFIR